MTTNTEIIRPAGPWIMTASGRAMAYLNPEPDHIAISDIATHLAKVCRFNGAVRAFYSVAQHSVLVSDLLPMDSGDGAAPGLLKIAGLFHDAHEFVLADLPTPMKWALQRFGDTTGIRAMEAYLDRAIMEAIGLPGPVPSDWRERIKAADLTALATERRDLMPKAAPGHPEWDIELPAASPARIEPLPWEKAEAFFLARARTLAEVAGLSGGAWER